MKDRLGRWTRRLLVGAATLVPLGAAFAFLSVEVSSQPRFCGSCHYMSPYYESWLTSTHKEVACVECHIPPGVVSEVRKKYEALAMVARYFTGTYSTNPWAEVDDLSCLRSGCHTKRVLLGKELYEGILFDHQPHLTEMRREKRLRCTTCHSQIVQGSHISVTPTTCFLCHFKETKLNEGTARCTLCHEVPDKMITTAGLSFDHGDVKRFNMNCMDCHDGVVKGQGEVPPERCYTCHNDTERLDRYPETEFLHRTHVTEHKVECLNCHIEVTHKIPAREEALTTPCESCHASPSGHSPVRDLYRGIGAKGVEPRPAPMYLAGIRCEACHNVPAGSGGRASVVSCMSCHGPKYLTIFETWQTGLARRLEGVTGELDAVRELAAGRDGAAAAALAEVEENIALIVQGRGIHNPGYAVDILDHAHQSLAGILAESGTSATLPWREASYETKCLKCHFGIEYLSRPAFEREFPHAPHVVTAGVRCTVCHGDLDDHGATKLTADGCDGCHSRIKRTMADVGPEECLGCHTAEIGKVSEMVAFPHEKHVEAGLGCDMCHPGVGEQPHREFARSADALPELGHDFCTTCHADDVPVDGEVPEGADCTKCHVDF